MGEKETSKTRGYEIRFAASTVSAWLSELNLQGSLDHDKSPPRSLRKTTIGYYSG